LHDDQALARDDAMRLEVHTLGMSYDISFVAKPEPLRFFIEDLE
jgi:hypothetical protein